MIVKVWAHFEKFKKKEISKETERYRVSEIKEERQRINPYPSSWLRQTLEKFTHGVKVDPVGAVEDNALLRDGLGQIFTRLRFTGTCQKFNLSKKI